MAKFDDIVKPLRELLDKFELKEYNRTGACLDMFGYAQAEYESMDEDYVNISLEWGTEGEHRKTSNTEYYRIAITDLLSDIPLDEKMALIQEG